MLHSRPPCNLREVKTTEEKARREREKAIRRTSGSMYVLCSVFWDARRKEKWVARNKRKTIEKRHQWER